MTTYWLPLRNHHQLFAAFTQLRFNTFGLDHWWISLGWLSLKKLKHLNKEKQVVVSGVVAAAVAAIASELEEAIIHSIQITFKPNTYVNLKFIKCNRLTPIKRFLACFCCSTFNERRIHKRNVFALEVCAKSKSFRRVDSF